MSNSQGIRKSMSESKSYKAKQVFPQTPIITTMFGGSLIS